MASAIVGSNDNLLGWASVMLENFALVVAHLVALECSYSVGPLISEHKEGNKHLSILLSINHTSLIPLGTYVNAIRIPHGQQVDLSDGDLLTFGHPTPVPEGCALPPSHGNSEFYFLFQKVQVRPQDFAAITEPKAPWAFSCGFRPVLPSGNHRIRPLSHHSPTSLSCHSKATLILDSIGSLSKLKPQPLTFSLGRGRRTEQPSQPRATRNRRKSAHTLLPELEDEITKLEEEQPPPKKEQRLGRYMHCPKTLRLQQRVPEESKILTGDTGPKLHITPSG